MTELEALRDCVSRTYTELATGAPGASVELGADVWIARSSIRHPIGNFAIRFAADHLPEKVLTEVRTRPHFRAFVMDGDTPMSLGDLALNHGLRERYQLAGMVLQKPTSPHTDVERAQSPEDALEIATFITETFFWRSPPHNRRLLAEIMASQHPRHEFYALRDDFGIVSAGTLTPANEVIGLYNLCVRVDARSRGIGAAMAAALGAIAAARSNYVVLTCDEELIPWYSQQGYQSVGSVRAFSA